MLHALIVRSICLFDEAYVWFMTVYIIYYGLN